ncbi:ATP-binding cassette domain-containing protein, partial [Campylobacter upsaliensis]|nr:ATP-binding cassette domain-containing protein [Campylobacter upsaliensis]
AGLSHRLTHLPSQLSGGEQQRVCIARALINNPELLLADEPTGNLDEANEQIVLQTLQKLKNEGKTIVLITHNPDL